MHTCGYLRFGLKFRRRGLHRHKSSVYSTVDVGGDPRPPPFPRIQKKWAKNEKNGQNEEKIGKDGCFIVFLVKNC